MGIRPSVRRGTVGVTAGAEMAVVVVVVVVRFGLPASAGAAQRTAARAAARRAMGERMPITSANRPPASILSFVDSRQCADPAVLRLAQQAAQPEEVVHPAHDRDR